MSTKAIHLELVSSLTSEAFVTALNCFIVRRGLISHLYNVNGSNFVGANRELQLIFKSEEFVKQVHNYAANMQFQWHSFLLKSLKYHWKRIIGKALLTSEEFSTLITQVEACLNSRTLIAVSNEPNDPSYLTPDTFL
jgi:hypothetical protein